MPADDPREERQSGSPGRSPGDPRKPFQIDRDRLLYSTAFRRLAGVTQVVSPGEGEVLHNRLTHTIKVAQNARRMAETLLESKPDLVAAWGGLDPDAAEAAALAHDLGHPPFGHDAEYVLDALVSAELCEADGEDPKTHRREGYEGNAQSFRIVTALATRRPGTAYGLDLTRATLNATLKYPWRWAENPKKPDKYGAYACDDPAFLFARGGPPIPDLGTQFRSLEAQLMDWADDIAYSVHDTEDFYRAGLIPLDRLASNPAEQTRFRSSIRERYAARGQPDNMDGEFDQVFSGLFANLPIRERFEGTRDQQERLYQFQADKIARYVRGTELVAPPGDRGEALRVPSDIRSEIKLLKELIRTYVIDNPALAAHWQGQRRIIRGLFEEFNTAVAEKRWALLPAFYRDRAKTLFAEKQAGGSLPAGERVRLVADTIASLTDRQALLLYHQFSGVSQTSMLGLVIS